MIIFKRTKQPESSQSGRELEAIWELLLHINGRIDGMGKFMIGTTVSIIVGFAGVLATVLLS